MKANQDCWGVLAIDKPSGLTSRDVVNHIQRLLKPIKVGHTGTLDPLATGVLLLAVGKATRLVEFAHFMDKRYEADFLLGQMSDTLDIHGQSMAVESTQPHIDAPMWAAEMKRWQGEIDQVPPQYSACRVGGKRAYELARQGIPVDLSARRIMIHQLELLRLEYPLVTMEIHCGSGTYVRSLGFDIAQALGTTAIMSRLVRTGIGRFRLKDCQQLAQMNTREDVVSALQPPVSLLPHWHRLLLTEQQQGRIRHGLPIAKLLDQQLQAGLSQYASVETCQQHHACHLAAVDSHGRLIAVLERREELFCPVRVFLD